jgi:hypothetical protein
VRPQRDVILLRTDRTFYRSAVSPALRCTILGLAYVRHRSEQPDTSGRQHDEKTEHHSVFDAAIALIVGWFRCGHLFRRRIEVNIAAVVHDTVLLLCVVLQPRQILRADRRFTVAAWDIEHVIRLAQA